MRSEKPAGLGPADDSSDEVGADDSFDDWRALDTGPPSSRAMALGVPCLDPAEEDVLRIMAAAAVRMRALSLAASARRSRRCTRARLPKSQPITVHGLWAAAASEYSCSSCVSTVAP
jgi:hypothetical protein